MKILFIAEKDASNLWTVNIIEELSIRGNQIYIYGAHNEYHNIRMFNNIGLKVEEIANLKDEFIDECDFIFCSINNINRVIYFKKYIFLYDFFTTYGQRIPDGGDIILKTNRVNYNGYSPEVCSVVVGCNNRENLNVNYTTYKKQFLFIDSGHYPFSYDGKIELAKTIVNICKIYPEYIIKIKPRFLRSDTNVAHKNKIHLYDAIEQICSDGLPINLIMLNEHKDMDELLMESSVVLCMYSTAFFKIIPHNKKIIMLRGLPNTNTIEAMNGFTWQKAEELFSESGCLVDYHNVCDYLPNGLECLEDFKEKCAPYSKCDNKCEKIVDFIEYCYENFISKGLFIKNCDTDLDSYREQMVVDEKGSWDKLIRNRIKNQLLSVILVKRDMINHQISMDDHIEAVDKQLNKIPDFSKVDMNVLNINEHKRFERKLIHMWDVVKGNPVSEALYIEALYRVSKWKMSELKEDYFICKRPFYYFMGIFHNDRNEKLQAAMYLNKYMLETKEAIYCEYQTDTDDYVNYAASILSGLFPFYAIEEGSNVALYGAGFLGNEYKNQIEANGFCKLKCFFDKNFDKILDDGIPVLGVEEINNTEFDYIVIALLNDKISQDVINELINKGIDKKKIIYVTKNNYFLN